MGQVFIINFLQGWSGKGVKHGGSPTFDTFLSAIKTAGLTDLLTTSSPYALFVPTDAAFSAMPKAKREALMADPKALADLVRAHQPRILPRAELLEDTR